MDRYRSNGQVGLKTSRLGAGLLALGSVAVGCGAPTSGPDSHSNQLFQLSVSADDSAKSPISSSVHGLRSNRVVAIATGKAH
jgi:hypothetical protein